MMKFSSRAAILLSTSGLAGCEGPQSALHPAGRNAEQIAQLFWWLVAVNALIWLLVIGLAVYASRIRPRTQHPRATKLLIIGGGVIFPVVVLTAYLTYGLALVPDLMAPAPLGKLRIAVSGEQWWWRVRYLPPNNGEPIELANEIRLPVGETIDLILSSPDVIHSFWVPSLAGKVDMIPGRTTRLTLEPAETGVYRGSCAEYCGTAHALMSFYVVVMEPEAFAAWLAHQAQPAVPPRTPLAKRGWEVFMYQGCSACHTIRGTQADGKVGPDLTHVGSRISLGAGILPNKPEAFMRWIAHTNEVKPGVHMPAFGMLSKEELRALAVFLEGLK